MDLTLLASYRGELEKLGADALTKRMLKGINPFAESTDYSWRYYGRKVAQAKLLAHQAGRRASKTWDDWASKGRKYARDARFDGVRLTLPRRKFPQQEWTHSISDKLRAARTKAGVHHPTIFRPGTPENAERFAKLRVERKLSRG